MTRDSAFATRDSGLGIRRTAVPPSNVPHTNAKSIANADPVASRERIPDDAERIANPQPIPNARSRITSVALAIATVGGVGYVPFAPGTFGSAAGLVVWWLLGP